jgi:hypothetical protein
VSFVTKEQPKPKGGWVMKYLRYLALLATFVFVLAPSTKSSQASAQVAVGIGIGAPGYIAPPACPYGYYDYYPYDCAPYGFYGPDWFVGGLFIGAGPWYHHGWYPGIYRGGFGYRGGVAYRGGFAPRGGFVGRPAGGVGFHGSAGFHGRGR